MKALALIMALTVACLTAGCRGEPADPATPMRIRWAAEREGALVIYVNTVIARGTPWVSQHAPV